MIPPEATYSCFVTTLHSSVRHMVLLEATSFEEAQKEAAGVMRQFETALSGDIYADDRLVATIQPVRRPTFQA